MNGGFVGEREANKASDHLLEALIKFQEWTKERDEIERDLKHADAAERLMTVLGIDTGDVRSLIGGCNAPIFARASCEIETMRMYLRDIAELADTGRNIHKSTFDPSGMGVHPAGWRVAEKMREVALQALGEA